MLGEGGGVCELKGRCTNILPNSLPQTGMGQTDLN
jgi:hypothetical protein